VFKININDDGDWVLDLPFPDCHVIIKSDEKLIEAIADVMAIKRILMDLGCIKETQTEKVQ